MSVKKITLLSIFFLVIALPCLFASSETFGFDILWRHFVSASTTVQILEYDASGSLPDNEKNLESDSSVQNVALLRYTSNEGGIHTLSYKATTLKTDDNSSHVGYQLFFDYEGRVVSILVGDDLGTTYPEEYHSAKTTKKIPFGSASSIVSDIFIRAILTDYDAMRASSTYRSTVTIERITE